MWVLERVLDRKPVTMVTMLANKSKWIQETFDWESRDADANRAVVAIAPAVRPSESFRDGVRGSSSRGPQARGAQPQVTVPTIRETSCARRGRCEHIGGVMASVLSKYGLGIDDLLGAIEDLKRSRSQQT